jgi:hypothetical protein
MDGRRGGVDNVPVGRMNWMLMESGGSRSESGGWRRRQTGVAY